MKQNIGDCIEAEGFLSCSLDLEIAENFTKNLLLVIYVPVINLKGIVDNGFAHITKFSNNIDENEVLINAFNVFKVLDLKAP